jgi:NADPH2:quinone reductase
MGAGLVIGTASTEEKRAFVRGLGADAAVDYQQADWPNVVLQKTDDRGVDIILESIGGDVFEQNFQCLATFGRYIVFGSTRGPGAPFEPRRLMQKSQSMAGIYLPVFFAKPQLIREAMSLLVSRALDGTLKTHVDRTLPLNRPSEAHQLLEERRVTGAIVLDPRASTHAWC